VKEREIALGSVVVFSADPKRTIAFYSALGVPLEDESHEAGGTPHAAADVCGVHIAVYPAEGGADVPGSPMWRHAGTTFIGFFVPDLDATVDKLRTIGTDVLREHQQRPWGCRAIVADPDGRAVEINQQGHCLGDLLSDGATSG
jgi:lactoylglutathione lyase